MFWCHHSPVTAVQDLVVYVETDVTMRTHVTNIVRACFSALRQIRSVRRSLPQHALLTLVHALVITKLDHCNSVLAGTAGYLQNRLQSVLNAAARIIYSCRVSDHTTPLLRGRHWLRVLERIQFQLCVLACHCLLHVTAPAYLADSLRPTSEVVARRRLQSADTTTLLVPPTQRVTFGDRAFQVAAARGHGRVCHHRSGPPHHCCHFGGRRKLISAVCRTSDTFQYNFRSRCSSCYVVFMFLPCVKCPCNFCEASL